MSATPSTRLTLGAGQRLKQARDFTRLKAQGRRLARGSVLMNWAELPGTGKSRLGVVTAKRTGNAVVRSRARRLLRQAFRLHQHDLRAPTEIVLVARDSIAGKPFAEVEHDFLAALRAAGLLKT
ncbi:MAG: ribonuclease P protein component [Limisphaerales bacterium]